jgi:hypothetical protein
VDSNRRRTEHLDQRRADPSEQRIAGCQDHDTTLGDAFEQRREPLAQRTRPCQALLSRKPRDEIEVPRTSYQHFGLLDQIPRARREVTPPSRSEPDYLDHASDCMPGIPPPLTRSAGTSNAAAAQKSASSCSLCRLDDVDTSVPDGEVDAC